MRLQPGATFGRYVIEELLGEGGMGSVYRAVDTRLERRVALKVLRVHPSLDAAPEAATDAEPEDGKGASLPPSAAERMLREARAAAAIEHANAVGIHDVGEVGDTPYIAMELVVGRSIRSYVGDAAVPLETRLKWLIDVARALQAAHARGLVHRDVKPDNVMVREDGTVKVLDFGIAWMRERGPLATTDQPSRPSRPSKPDVPPWYVTLTAGNLVGTPRYMAPEQLRGGAVDGRADQFAWGVMAYELLAGTPPWRGAQVSLTMLADVLENDPAPLRSVAPRIPPAIEAVVTRALSKDPEARFASMSDIVAALERSSLGGAAWAGRKRAAWAGALGAVALLAAGVAIARRASRDPASGTASASLATPARTFDPGMLESSAEPPYIVAHLDAALGVTTRAPSTVTAGDGGALAGPSDATVTRWVDQSGNGNDAVAGRVAPTLAPSAIRGRPALHFDAGAYLTIPDGPLLQFGKDDFMVAVVARHDRPLGADPTVYGMTTGYGTLLLKTETPTPFRGVGMFLNYPRPVMGTRLGVQTQYGHYVLSTSEHLNDGVARLLEARRIGGVLEVRVNGVLEARFEGADDDVSAPGMPVFIGAHDDGGQIIQQLRGDIAEVIVMRNHVNTRRLTQMEDGLLDKYGIPRPAPGAPR